MTKPVKVEDYRILAKRRLPKMVFDYLDGGAEDEAGLAHNRAVFGSWRFKPKRLTNVSKRDLSITLLGQKYPLPFLIGPTGLNGLLRPQGDAILARCAAKEGIPFVLSTASTQSIEEVARSSDGEKWFQLYVMHRDLALDLTRRALASDYSTLVLTVDVPVNGWRERDMRNGFGLPMRYTAKTVFDGITHPAWSLDLLRNGMPKLANFASAKAVSSEAQAALMRREMDASFDWEALAQLRAAWPKRLLVKGILSPEDATRCIAEGADGVILSNHGARQLDGCLSPMETLGNVRNATSAPVLVDSGLRRGSDVVKALCLGANAVMLGRATLFGLAAEGEEGVLNVISLLRQEIDRTLALIGAPSVADLSSELLVRTITGE
ncbi:MULTISPECIES: alpha-hydroxy-acid oxidizing protein [Agrobacterium tumefaciens complex]|jgi:(S)-mandelate dehydrogenase|uniref:alpha-hydroxy-acid oxidizing protein n=1 Tax=Agrobacterium tumefaciens TaxID=358 RepID=UPI000FE29140|nr:alpha-hydroxy-acid oxidizing protein [Agrobacterium tumefaciens]QAA98395.1 mandelate dehydrogenase [Agrobacterium tumefaciens]QAB01080.1 mandelate dehydrogenase [Agrobacterium tumefaciens]